MSKDDFSDLFGDLVAVDHIGQPPLQISITELKQNTGRAIMNYNRRMSTVKNFCRECGKPFEKLQAVKYRSGRTYLFARPCGHKQ